MLKSPFFIRFLPCLALIGVLATSCIKDEPEIKDFSFSANPEWGIPLAFASISAERIIDNFDDGGLVELGGDGLVSIVYTDSLDPVLVEDFLTLPDQRFEQSFLLDDQGFGELVEEGSLTISETYEVFFDSPEGDRIDSIRFNSGTFRLLVGSSNGIPMSGTVGLLNPVNGEVMYQVEFQDANPPVFVDLEEALDNVLLQFEHSGTANNGLTIAYELTFTYGGEGVNSEVNVDFEMLDMSIRSFRGYMAPRNFDLEADGLRINMFDNVYGAQIRIENPRLNFFFNNGLGLGARLNIQELSGSNPDGEVLVIPGGNIVPLPNLGAAPAPGEYAFTTMLIDNSLMEPSITEFLAIQPNFVEGQFSLTVNPEDEQTVFVNSEATLDISYEAVIPVFGSIANFNLSDTTDISLNDVIADVEDITEIDRLDIRLFVDNGLPLDAALQIVFTDSIYQPIDSLFADLSTIFASAPVERNVDADHPNYGRAIGSTRTIIDIPIPRQRLLNLENASRIIIRVSGHTSGNDSEPIRLFEQDKFDLHLGAKVVLNIDE